MNDDQLERILRRVRFVTTPAEDERILGDAVAALETQVETSAPEGEPEAVPHAPDRRAGRGHRLARLLPALVGVAALITVGVVLWLGRAQPTWAQVVEAVRARPWIQMTGEGPDQERDTWFSPVHQILAIRGDESVRFEDHGRGVVYQYALDEQKLYRMPLDSAGSRETFQVYGELFSELFRADATLELSPKAGLEIVEQKRRTLEDGGREWIEYDLSLRPSKSAPAEADKDLRFQMVFRIDPKSRLPYSVTMTAPDGEAAGGETWLFRYPEQGPSDVYALGVPRGAMLVDLVPTGELERVVEGIKSSAEGFDPYFALNVMSDSDAPWYVGTPFLVWDRGTQYRMEYGIVDPDAPAPEPPAKGADETAWWKERSRNLWFVTMEVSDGERLHDNEAIPPRWGEASKQNPLTWEAEAWPQPKWHSLAAHDWPASTAPLYLAYSQNAARVGRPREEVQLASSPKDGPPGTVLLTRWIKTETGERLPGSEERFWIDPARSYMTARYELGDDLTVTVEEAAQSPRGIWYPTLMRHASVSKRNGERTIRETITRHYLHFDVKLPATLFRPTDRAMAKEFLFNEARE